MNETPKNDRTALKALTDEELAAVSGGDKKPKSTQETHSAEGAFSYDLPPFYDPNDPFSVIPAAGLLDIKDAQDPSQKPQGLHERGGV